MKPAVPLKLTFSARDTKLWVFSCSEYYILIMFGHALNIMLSWWYHHLDSIPIIQRKKKKEKSTCKHYLFI